MANNWFHHNQFSRPPPLHPNANYQYQPPQGSYGYWPPEPQNTAQICPLPNLNEPPPVLVNPPPYTGNYFRGNYEQNSGYPNYPQSSYSNYEERYSNYNCPPTNLSFPQNNHASGIEQKCADFLNLINKGQPLYNFKDELESYKTRKNELEKRYPTKSNLEDVAASSQRNHKPSSSSYNTYQRSRSPYQRSQSPYQRGKSPINKLRGYNKSQSFRSRSFQKKNPSTAVNSSRDNRSRSLSPQRRSPSKTTEREQILQNWRKNYCATREEVCNKIKELSKEDILEQEKLIWTRTTPADLYYARDENNPKVIKATPKLIEVCNSFEENLVLRAKKVNQLKPKYEPPPRKNRARICKHKSEQYSSSGSSDEDFTDEEDCSMEELTRKQQHPDRLHPEMWYNDMGEMNDGPLCRCSRKARKTGIRHGIYAGERFQEKCDLDNNNADKLYHYRITISPPTNFLIKTPTIIQHDEHEFIFEGFSMLSHKPLIKLPTCKVIRFNIEYTIFYIEEKIPDNFTIRELDLFYEYLFKEVLELVDLDLKAAGDSSGCSQFHFMPRFARKLPDNGKEILSMKEVLQYLLNSSVPLIKETELESMIQMSQYEWQSYADEIKGMVVTYPGKKPCSVRVDQLDRNLDLQEKGNYKFPEIVHFGIRPPQLSYAGNPEYQKAWRDYVKFRHLLANMSKPTFEDKRKLEAKENKLQEMRTQSKMKRDVTVAVSAEGFYRTGIMCDIVQHAMLIPVLVCHLRFHNSLSVLEDTINYRFSNRGLLQLALTHPSYRENFGTNPDHARNTLTNCGIRQPEYGDRRIHYMNTRKRGINTLINIMSRFGKKQETESNITHNERLEFLGDAVVEFLSSIHLFYTFPDLEEGGLATYRAAIVQNQHLAVLARTLNLDHYMLYAHGSDLCHDLELRHAMANCFEALMGALFLDGGIEVADRVFSETLFKERFDLLEVWQNLPPHPLQEQEPQGDREWIPKFKLLQKLTEFENSIGVEFMHIRLLARGFTDRSVGYTNLTLGSNQRLEFLGDTVLQLIASEYLYKFFPEHHEGHLSLLRSSLVNNRTQAVVCDDLGMANFAVYNNPKAELKTKDRADLLEAFIGALYVDKGLEYCQVFCQVTLFPRLQDFIMNQDWNDPKSKLQQCCLTLRTMDGGEPDIPVYKVIECKGPTNTRVYTVAVYFRGKRLASAMGHSIQQAEMNAAKKALEISKDLFPQLDHQKRVIAKSMKKQRYPHRRRSITRSRSRSRSKSRRKKWGERSRSLSRSPSSRKRPKRRSSSRRKSPLFTRRRQTRSRSISPDYRPRRSSSRQKSRSRSLSKGKSKSRSRSRSISLSKGKSRSRSLSKGKSKSRSRSRSRSLSKGKSRSRSRTRSRSLSKGKSRSRSLSKGKSKSQNRSRSRSLSKGKSKSRSRSRSRSSSVESKRKSRSPSCSSSSSSDDSKSRKIKSRRSKSSNSDRSTAKKISSRSRSGSAVSQTSTTGRSSSSSNKEKKRKISPESSPDSSSSRGSSIESRNDKSKKRSSRSRSGSSENGKGVIKN